MFGKKKKTLDPNDYNKVLEFPKPSKTTVAIDDHSVHIFRKGVNSALTVGLSGEKTIPLSSITSVQFKKPGLTSGYLQFGILGGNETQGIMNAVKDENAVIFIKKELDQALELKKYVEDLINKNNSKSTNSIDAADQIKKFAELKDQGIITEEEFASKKKQILGI